MTQCNDHPCHKYLLIGLSLAFWGCAESPQQSHTRSAQDQQILSDEDLTKTKEDVEEEEQKINNALEELLSENPLQALEDNEEIGGYNYGGHWIKPFPEHPCFVNHYHSYPWYAEACEEAGHEVIRTTCYGPLCSVKIDITPPEQ